LRTLSTPRWKGSKRTSPLLQFVLRRYNQFNFWLGGRHIIVRKIPHSGEDDHGFVADCILAISASLGKRLQSLFAYTGEQKRVR